jgi:hypothetical protein
MLFNELLDLSFIVTGRSELSTGVEHASLAIINAQAK